MKITIKNTSHALFVPFLLTTLTTIGMEPIFPQLQLGKKVTPKPTTTVKIYFKPTKSAFYITPEQIKHLNEKGIPTPVVPVGREVDSVKVIEACGSITNWKSDVPKQIQQYELKKLQKEQLSFNQRLQKSFAIDSLTFPSILPTELCHYASGESTYSFTINGYPVQATLKSNGNFQQEHKQCMEKFYKKASSKLSDSAIAALVANETLVQTRSLHFIDIGLLLPFPIPTTKTQHGPNGCPDRNTFEQKLIQHKTGLNNICDYISQRESGQLRKKPLSTNIQKKEALFRYYAQLEQKNILPHMAQKQPQPKCVHASKCTQVDIESKNICPQDTEIFLEFTDNAKKTKPLKEQGEYGRHGSECTLL